MSDDFQLVSRRRRGRGPPKSSFAGISPVQLQGKEDIEVDRAVVLKKIQDARNALSGSEFLNNVETVLQEALDVTHSKGILEIICYGLGHFTDCGIARHQLALLLIIQEQFEASVYIHDPVFYCCEVNLLKGFGFHIILENEEGKRLVDQGITTLLYTPHCSKQLMNNFLWKNWSLNLRNCMIFGNSFSSVVDNKLASDSYNSEYINKIQPYTLELQINNSFVYTDVFNSTSIHVFPEDKLSVLEPSFWTADYKEPVYPSTDTEFITKPKE